MKVIAKSSGFGGKYLLFQDEQEVYHKIYAFDDSNNIMDLDVLEISIEEFDKYFN